ncbi:Down syndrome cell adhesion molecule-like protein Dscam2 isoform X2 [Ischnura elegans]|uniref:Down syndrome cell adhesion molecule-like protein Dscam2 isoform X2 n=1 Tax=Ischnura elegans TaxID=197161 RepID=UPI001ED882F0|nr:Down syndrome cell adhesion molecule-like protein Dscam2 isoform X2 [Ischnura elegans]
MKVSCLVTLLLIGYSAVGLPPLLAGQGPLFLVEPPPRLEFSNSSGGRLDCSAQGSPSPALRWILSDGAPALPVPGLRLSLRNGSLAFPPFAAASFRPDVHAATYRCVAANALGRALSREVKLRAVVLQHYEVRVLGAFVTRGNAAVLKCHVPSVVREYLTVTSWLQDGTFNIYPSSDGDDKFHMLPTGELLVLNAGPADAYSSYHCRVTHRLSGQTMVSSIPGKITISEARGVLAPQLEERVIHVEARRDELVTLPCFVTGHPPPEYRWFLGGQSQLTPVPEDERRYPLGPLLVILRARPADSGRYLCSASNSGGGERLEVSLVVSAPLSARVNPARQAAAVGRSAEFACTASGHPVTTITWAKDGQPLREGPRVHLVSRSRIRVESVQREDEGIYQCFVKNDHDMAQGSAELRLGDAPPLLVYRFIRQTIQPGPSVSLKCIASGNPTPNIKWTLDGFPLPQNERFMIGQYVAVHGDVISHVNITGVRVEDGGTYECVATNRIGEARHSAQLNVYGAPHVRAMGDISAIAGETLRVSCPVGGFPVDSIQWLRGDRLLPVNRRQIVFTNGTLVIEKVQPSQDGGAYTCTASYKGGRKASGTAHVNVMVPPKLNPFSARSDLHLGERVGLQCTVSRGDPPLLIEWLKDGVPLPSSGPDLVVRSIDEFTSLVSIAALSPAHSGNYTCLARNGVAQASHSAAISVNVPPSWIVEPQNKNAELGQQVMLDCQVEGFPKPTISWKRATDMKPGQYRGLPFHGQGIQVFPNGSLLLEAVRQEDEGPYLCEAGNGVGVGLSAVVTLSVNAPVHFKVRSRKEVVRRGASAVLRCRALGDAPIAIAWRRDDGARVDMLPRVSVKNTSVPEGLFSELTIQEAKREDGGVYTCLARNAFGQDQMALHLLVQDAPSMPTELRLVDAGSRRASLSWTPPQDGHSPITRYVVRYKAAEDSWRSSSAEVSVDGSSSSATLSQLLPATTYLVRVLAENQLGEGEPSAELRVRTAEEPPSAPPRGVLVEARAPRQLHVLWEPPPAESWNGALRGHYVGLREHSVSKGNNQYNFTTVPWQANGKAECRLDSLKKFAKYGIVVQAFNSKGAGPMSEEVVAQTLEDVPEAAPRSVRCMPLSPDSLQISWQPPAQDLTHGVVQGYRLFYETSPSEESDHTDSLTKMTPSLSTDLHGLLKYTNYSIQVLAFTRVGDGVRSTAIHCRTKEDVPGPPAAIKALPMSADSVLVAWMPPKQPNGHVVEYGLYVRGVEAGRPVDSRALHTPHLEMEVTELKRRARYEFWVTAFTKVGEGQSTPVASASPTPQGAVAAAVASFGGSVAVAWRRDVRLPCRAVGVPSPQRQWLAGEAPVGSRRPRAQLAPDGALFLPNVQRADDGDYTCRVWNEHGRDVITHHLVVQVPPAPPLLLATAASAHSVSLQWKIGDEGGSAVRGVALHVKAEGGEWEEIRVERGRSTHQLTGLRCGTQYRVYATAHNRIGVGAPSAQLSVRTQGGRPQLPPPARDMLAVEPPGNGSAGAVALRLSRWPDGGCPIQRFVVEYSSNGDWIVVGNNILVHDSFPLVGLSPATLYRLRITAINSAGSAQGSYQFTTPGGSSDYSVEFGVSSSGDPSGGTGRSTPMLKDARVLVPAIAAVLALVLATGAGICLCFRLKPSPPTTSATQQEQSTASMENKHNLAQREQYYASARKAPPSPAPPNPGFTTLDRIPEYAEDIYPYATFHVPTDVTDAPGATKMQTFGFREGTLGSCESSAVAVPRKHSKGEFHRRKRCGERRGARGDRRDSEDYDSFGSESDTEQGTSSRTESSNQLEESVPATLPVSAVAPEPTHLNLLYPGPESSTSPEPSPVAERRSFPRTGKPSSRRCGAVGPTVPVSESSEAECEAEKCRRASPHFLAMQSTKDFSIRV